MDKVTIDNDFLSKLVEINGRDDLVQLITDFFLDLDVSPEMHSLVYEKEHTPNQNDISKVLFDDEVVRISDFAQITSCNTKKNYYELHIKKIYKEFTDDDYPCSNVCTDWVAGKSLGEVHTVVFSIMLGYDCFLSDDRDARDLANIVFRLISKPINVRNRADCCEQIRSLPDETPRRLKRNDLRVIEHKN